jgi:hypothetical protein
MPGRILENVISKYLLVMATAVTMVVMVVVVMVFCMMLVFLSKR